MRGRWRMNIPTNNKKSMLLSGRYFLTITSGVAFLYTVWQRVLPPEAIATIITMVFSLYFSRQDRNGGSK